MGMFTRSKKSAAERTEKKMTDIAHNMTHDQLVLALLLKIGASSELYFTDHPFAKEATKRCGCDQYGWTDTQVDTTTEDG